ncbi:VanZ family protein [Blastococcus sp. SYSU D00669]
MTPADRPFLPDGPAPFAGYLDTIARAPSVPATVAAGVLLAVLLAAVVRRRRGLTFLTGAGLAVVLGVTIVPWGGWTAFGLEDDVPAHVLADLAPRPGDLTAWQHAGDGPLNVVLFVPLGFLLALLLRAPVRGALACALLSLGIECYQAALTSRVGAFADVVANSLGAALGATAALVVLVVARRRSGSGRDGRTQPVDTRRPALHADRAG